MAVKKINPKCIDTIHKKRYNTIIKNVLKQYRKEGTMNLFDFFNGMTIDGHEVDTSKLEETGKVIVNGEEYNAIDFLSDEDKKYIFDEDMLRTQNDIIYDIDFLLREIQKDKESDTKHSAAYYKRYIDLLKRFKQTIEQTVFPQQLEDWWFYDYEVEETGVTLRLKHAKYADMNSEGYYDSFSIDTCFDLIKIGTELLTVEQYAKANDVTTTTVRQWIRRGKLRTAVKQGSEWRIPDLAEVRDRGYKFVQYEWKEFLTGFPEKYDYINKYRLVTINQNDEHKDLYEVTFTRNKEDIDAPDKEIELSQKEKEKFELLLISNPFVKPTSSTIVSRW